MPYKDPLDMQAYLAKYYQKNRRALNERNASRRQKATSRLAFAGVDGEGGNINGRHEYLLLRAGDRKLYTGKPLSTMECIEFLASLPTDRIHVGYYFDYDVTMILRDLPQERIAKLLDRDSRDIKGSGWPLMMDVDNYRIDWLPRKEFRVRHMAAKKSVIINDVGTFFQASFLSSLERWQIGTPEELEMIRVGKLKRAGFVELEEETDAYNELEIRLLEELMTKFRGVLDDIDVRPMKWQGPGNIAASLLKRHDTVRNRDSAVLADHPDFVFAAQASYYGGWFEVNRVGQVPGPVYQYDINSAYPHAMLSLPCLVHSTIRKVTRRPKTGELYLAHIQFSHKGPRLWGSFPFRNKNGNISHPMRGAGWYWSHEIENALPGTMIRTNLVYVVEKRCSCKPFEWVSELYDKRLEVGKDAKGLALKLGLNSLYGKLAQSIGRPQYSNPVWASLITSITRGMLLSAMREAGDDCIMVATDALYSLKPLSLPTGTALGEWSCEVAPDIFIIQPGLYAVGGKLNTMKTRGVSKPLIIAHFDKFRAMLPELMKCKTASDGVALGGVRIPVTQFMGLTLANARRNYEDSVGQWLPVADGGREIRFAWYTKRGDVVGKGDSYLVLGMQDTGGSLLESMAYSKPIGGGAMQDVTEEQPDWVFNMLGLD